MGTLIGDALGAGCHWYYDYNDLWEKYGTWVNDYVDPCYIKDGKGMDEISSYRYQVSVRAGMNSQTGQLIQVLLETIAKNTRENFDYWYNGGKICTINAIINGVPLSDLNE